MMKTALNDFAMYLYTRDAPQTSRVFFSRPAIPTKLGIHLKYL
jgi:hypothetical protein